MKKISRRLLNIFGAIAGFLLLILLFLIFFQNKIVFYPSEKLGDYQKPLEGIVDVSIPLSDGKQMHGWYLNLNEKRPTVIFFHGNGGNVAGWSAYFRLFHELEFNAVIIDYRGYGKSDGSIARSEKTLYHDADSVLSFVRNELGIAPERIISWGRSLGCTAALHIAQNNQMAAVILEAPFFSGKKVAREILPIPVGPLLFFPMRNDRLIQNNSSPLLIASSFSDKLFPIETHGKPLFELAKQPKLILEVGGGHNDPPFLRYNDAQKQKLIDFFNNFTAISVEVNL